MAMKWIMHTESEDSIIHFTTILFTGTAGAMIHFTDMVIHPGTIHFTTLRGDGEDMAGIHPTADGDGAILLITVFIVHFTVVITAGDIHTVITDMVDITAVTTEDITVMDGMQIQEIMIMEDADLPAQT